MRIRHLCFSLACFLAVLPACREEPRDAALLEEEPLVDTLRTAFLSMKTAWESGQMDRVLDMLHPLQAEKLAQHARERGYTSAEPLLRSLFGPWPDPDTLTLVEVKLVREFARLTFTGSAAPLYGEPDRIRYTLLLYRRCDGHWKLNGITALERRQRDPFGNEITVHETDLPPSMRFPKCL